MDRGKNTSVEAILEQLIEHEASERENFGGEKTNAEFFGLS